MVVEMIRAGDVYCSYDKLLHKNDGLLTFDRASAVGESWGSSDSAGIRGRMRRDDRTSAKLRQQSHHTAPMNAYRSAG